MRGSLARRAVAVAGLFWIIALLLPSQGQAFEFFDGRLQVHGFYEAQIRAMARDFDASDDWDLAQWWNVLNLEIEAEIAPDGWGPFDLIGFFSRIEARYDCVWTRGCGMFSSADTYGDRAKKLPKRLADGRRSGFKGQSFTGDDRKFIGYDRDQLFFRFRDMPSGSRAPGRWFNLDGVDTLFLNRGVDNVFGTADDPAPDIFSRVLRENCRFGFRKIKGSEEHVGTQILGPWTPKCKIRNLGAIADRPNPLSPRDLNPVTDLRGSGVLPLRPVPNVSFDTWAPKNSPRGIYYPNQGVLEHLDDFDNFDQNFRQEELAWNRGASQQQTKELKELYFDLELFDSRLWVRAGKQSIVWGKTELFRTTDQFNPQDLALASLPSLEESRISLWGLRGVWSFYQVGPLEDVRLELAMNYDDFEPNDLGRCGEPYSPLPVCNKTLGLFVHGLTGFGVAGEIKPPKPWNSWKGIEVGARLEFRWNRFSFALMDFYGYNDLPYQDQLHVYSRNVDPNTGRPRSGESRGSCRTGNEASCLTPDNALRSHSVNQQLFNMICSTSVGFSGLDLAACGQTVFNSAEDTDPGGATNTQVVVAVGNVLAGDTSGLVLPGLVEALSGQTLTVNPLVQLSVDPNDGDFLTIPESGFFGPGITFILLQGGLQGQLTDQQEALLGCGPYYGTFCDGSNPETVGKSGGIDLMNTEASALMQSWPGFEGTTALWDTRDGSVAQPGTVGFEGGPVCTRYENGKTFILPGCRGPGDPGYDINVDGSTTGRAVNTVSGFVRTHPFTDQPFRTEMAILSWNALIGLVALSAPVNPGNIRIDEFDASQPFRTGACSFAQPQFCNNVSAFYNISGLQRNVRRAGGNLRFGRRDFDWAGGASLALRYEKRNVLGLSVDWAEDFTKSSWGVEMTWIEGVPFTDNNEFDGRRKADTYNLTVSVDRPTFINFLNANRTFFFNTQWFVQYVDRYRQGFTSNGPWNVLATFSIQTGFFRDRFQPNMTFVYDFGSNSGAWLPQVTYRYTENFSVTFGLALFSGRFEGRPMALTPTSLQNRVGRGDYTTYVENGLSVVRERDEAFLRVRYSF